MASKEEDEEESEEEWADDDSEGDVAKGAGHLASASGWGDEDDEANLNDEEDEGWSEGGGESEEKEWGEGGGESEEKDDDSSEDGWGDEDGKKDEDEWDDPEPTAAEETEAALAKARAAEAEAAQALAVAEAGPEIVLLKNKAMWREDLHSELTNRGLSQKDVQVKSAEDKNVSTSMDYEPAADAFPLKLILESKEQEVRRKQDKEDAERALKEAEEAEARELAEKARIEKEEEEKALAGLAEWPWINYEGNDVRDMVCDDMEIARYYAKREIGLDEDKCACFSDYTLKLTIKSNARANVPGVKAPAKNPNTTMFYVAIPQLLDAWAESKWMEGFDYDVATEEEQRKEHRELRKRCKKCRRIIWRTPCGRCSLWFASFVQRRIIQTTVQRYLRMRRFVIRCTAPCVRCMQPVIRCLRPICKMLRCLCFPCLCVLWLFCFPCIKVARCCCPKTQDDDGDGSSTGRSGGASGRASPGHSGRGSGLMGSGILGGDDSDGPMMGSTGSMKSSMKKTNQFRMSYDERAQSRGMSSEVLGGKQSPGRSPRGGSPRGGQKRSPGRKGGSPRGGSPRASFSGRKGGSPSSPRRGGAGGPSPRMSMSPSSPNRARGQTARQARKSMKASVSVSQPVQRAPTSPTKASSKPSRGGQSGRSGTSSDNLSGRKSGRDTVTMGGKRSKKKRRGSSSSELGPGMIAIKGFEDSEIVVKKALWKRVLGGPGKLLHGISKWHERREDFIEEQKEFVEAMMDDEAWDWEKLDDYGNPARKSFLVPAVVRWYFKFCICVYFDPFLDQLENLPSILTVISVVIRWIPMGGWLASLGWFSYSSWINMQYNAGNCRVSEMPHGIGFQTVGRTTPEVLGIYTVDRKYEPSGESVDGVVRQNCTVQVLCDVMSWGTTDSYDDDRCVEFQTWGWGDKLSCYYHQDDPQGWLSMELYCMNLPSTLEKEKFALIVTSVVLVLALSVTTLVFFRRRDMSRQMKLEQQEAAHEAEELAEAKRMIEEREIEVMKKQMEERKNAMMGGMTEEDAVDVELAVGTFGEDITA